MTALHLTTTATAPEIVGAGQAITHRAMGKARLMLMFVLVLIGGTAFGQGIAWVTGIAAIDAMLVSVYSLLGAMVTFFLTAYFNRRSYGQILNTSAFRQSPCPITLSSDGLNYEPRTLPWSGITSVGRWKNCTLLHFSPADALVIPDRDLPAPETPETFAARIESWRKAAGAKG